MSNEEQVTQGQKAAISILGGVVIFLLISNLAVIATMENKETPKKTTTTTDGEEHVFEIPLPAETVKPEPATDPNPIQTSPHYNSLDQKYDALLREGVAAFDGSMGGYKKGVRFIQAKIINAPDFEGTEYSERAQAFLKKHEDKLNETISVVFDKMKTRVEELHAEQRWNEAANALRTFPQQYCSIHTWAVQYSDLKKSILDAEADWKQDVLSQAKAKAEAGDLSGAIQFLSSKKKEMSGRLSYKTTTAINSKIEDYALRIEEKKHAASETVEPADPSIYRHASDETIEFWLDFEKVPGPVNKGETVTDHDRPGSVKCLKAVYNPELTYNWEEVSIRYAYTSARTRVLSFWYYIEKPTPYLTITSWNPNAKAPFFRRISSPKIGEWAYYYCATTALSGTWAKPPVNHLPGASFTTLQFNIGAKGDPQLGLYIDNICISQGTSTYMFPGVKDSSAFIKSTAFNYMTDFCIMDYNKLINLIPLLNPKADRNKVVILGGSPVDSNFLTGCAQKNKDISFIRSRSAGSILSLTEAEPELDRMISRENPALAVLLIGTAEAGTATDLSIILDQMNSLAELCRKNGVIAVFMTVPPVHDTLKKRAIENFNDRIKRAAHIYQYPVIDVYAALSRPRGTSLSTYLTPEGTFTPDGHMKIETAFSKLFTLFRQSLLLQE